MAGSTLETDELSIQIAILEVMRDGGVWTNGELKKRLAAALPWTPYKQRARARALVVALCKGAGRERRSWLPSHHGTGRGIRQRRGPDHRRPHGRFSVARPLDVEHVHGRKQIGGSVGSW